MLFVRIRLAGLVLFSLVTSACIDTDQLSEAPKTTAIESPPPPTTSPLPPAAPETRKPDAAPVTKARRRTARHRPNRQPSIVDTQRQPLPAAPQVEDRPTSTSPSIEEPPPPVLAADNGLSGDGGPALGEPAPPIPLAIDANATRHSPVELEPTLELGSHWLSNPDAQADPLAKNDLVAVVRPGLRAGYDSDEVSVRSSVAMAYERFAGAQTPETKRYSEWLGVAQANLKRATDRDYAYQIDARLSRTVDPPDLTVANRLVHFDTTDDARVALNLQESSLSAAATYKLDYQAYSRTEDRYLDRLQQAPGISLEWQVDERVRLLADGAFEVTQYRTTATSTSALPTHGDSTILPVTIGASANFADYFTAVLIGGVARVDAAVVAGEQTLVGKSELAYDPHRLVRARVGVQKNVEATSGFSWVDVLKGYVGLEVVPTSEIKVSLDGRHELLWFGGKEKLSNERNDTRDVAALRVSYQVSPSIVASATDELEVNRSNFIMPQGYDASYKRNDIYLQFTLLL